jgi:chromosome segregation protein
MLKSIELIGFKSFAKSGKLDFTNSVTAIVGPNGSGKSNTAEAFRFVLGEQGSKVMRVKKGTDLIWSGSRAVPKSSRAGVRIVLDNSSGKLGVDFAEVVIERSVLADGSYEYAINGSKVRLKDIQELLASANIGSSGHHIISQGQSDRVLSASPKERREMLEDALGLKSYILRKAEAARKLDATSANLEQVKSTQRELKPQLRYIKKQADAVEDAKRVSRELERLFAIYIAAEQSDIEQALSNAKSALQEPQTELKQVKDNIASLRDRLEQVTNSTDDVDTTEIDRSNALVRTLRAELGTLKQELAKTDGQIEMLDSMSNVHKSRPETVPREAVRTILMRVQEYIERSQIESASVEIRKFISKVLDADDNNNDEVVDNSKDIDELKQRQVTLRRDLQSKQEALNEAEAELERVQAEHHKSKQDTTELERDIYKETAKHNELSARVSELERSIESTVHRRERLLEDVAEVEALLGKHIMCDGEYNTEQIPTRRDIERLKLHVESASGLSYEVVDEYNKLLEQYTFLEEQIQDLSGAADKLAELMDTLDKQARDKFNNGLENVNEQFGEFFSVLFGGGSAKLELMADRDDAEGGVGVTVQLPRKRVTTLETLSGGERALTSIALIFAMSQVNPPPFIILDETDAALDEANSRRYAEVVQRLSGKSQVILITHNRATMAVADTLYGVTMGNDGVSQLLSVKLKDAEQYAK